MMAFVIFLLLILLILTVSSRVSISRKLSRLEADIAALQKTVTAPPLPAKEPVAEAAAPAAEPPLRYPTSYWQTGFEVVEPPPAADTEPKAAEPPAVPQPAPETTPAIAAPTGSAAPTRKPSFFERNPDLEKFIGENLVSKIGIAILVLAIGYFVKYAIDNEWIGTVGRVAVGIACGAVLVGIAHRLRLAYHAFSSVMAGGGLAVFYFTITLAFQQYHLFSQPAAFVIMLLITGFAVALSLLYNRQELAVIALAGGFAAPLLLNTGSGNYITLFIYLILLNTGLLLIAYQKTWRILNATAFVCTILLFGSWLYMLSAGEVVAAYRNGFLFATVFYLLFLVINIANNLKEKKHFVAFDFSILLANTALYFSAGLYCLHRMNASGYNGLFSAAMGVFNLGVTYFLLRKKSIDSNILYLLIGITLSFVSLTAPLQLQGHFITLFWASEAVLLCWLYFTSNIAVLRYATLIIYGCMLLSLLGDWQNVYGALSLVHNATTPLVIIANRGFITSLYAAAATCALVWLLRKNNPHRMSLTPAFFRFCALLILFIAGNLEAGYQFRYYYPFAPVASLYQALYSLLFVVLFCLSVKRVLPMAKEALLSYLPAGSLLVYFLLLPQTARLLLTLRSPGYQAYNWLFFAHWVIALLAAFDLYLLTQQLRNSYSTRKTAFTWLLSAAAVALLSAEVYLIVYQLFYPATAGEVLSRIYIRSVLPVLWGLCSFGFMWLGMAHKYKTLRIVSLSLFSVTLLKLFLYDISNIPVAGKIVAFFCLGVLLLIVSFMYQRVKQMIIEDEAKPGV